MSAIPVDVIKNMIAEIDAAEKSEDETKDEDEKEDDTNNEDETDSGNEADLSFANGNSCLN